MEIKSLRTNDTPISVKITDNTQMVIAEFTNVTEIDDTCIIVTPDYETLVLQFVRLDKNASIHVLVDYQYWLLTQKPLNTPASLVGFYGAVMLFAVLGLAYKGQYRFFPVKEADGNYTYKAKWPRHRSPVALAIYLVLAYIIIIQGVLVTMDPGPTVQYGDNFFRRPARNPTLLAQETYNFDLTTSSPTTRVTLPTTNLAHPESCYAIISSLTVSSTNIKSTPIILSLESAGSSPVQIANITFFEQSTLWKLNVSLDQSSTYNLTISRVNPNLDVTGSFVVEIYTNDSLIAPILQLYIGLAIGIPIIILVIWWDIKLEKIFGRP
ncbi:MAG: hypothetical protein K9W43_14070 [Candidatus Thorarchaeota archaeon]|nr:hypothetical protein [Candidatus Thorarchaeota archaeon]